MQNGTLQDIEFISVEESHDDGLDEDPVVAEVVHEARWKIRRKVTEEQARTIFERALDFAGSFGSKKDHKELLVRIKTESGQVKTTNIDTNGEEVLEQSFVENEIVTDFDKPLAQRYGSFRDDIIGKMVVISAGLDK